MKKVLTLLLLIHAIYGHAQTINTFAGNGVATYGGDGGPATAASLNRPIACFRDAAGNLLISDFNNHRIRMVNAAGVISTICGTGISGFSGDGGPASAARISSPEKILIDGAGNIYFSDFFNYCIRKINTSGIISTIAGTPGVSGYTGDGGPATAATFWYPCDMVFDAAGNMYVTDEWNNRIRKINTAGIISTFAGAGPTGFMSGGYSGDGGPASVADINFPAGIVINAAGDIIFSDDGNYRIREISPAGIITTIAGDGVVGSLGDGGPATACEVNSAEGLCLDLAGNVYICESGGNKIRLVTVSTGIISTFAATGVLGYAGDGGPAATAEMDFPEDIFVDTNSACVFICDSHNNRVRAIGSCASVVPACNSISMPDTLNVCHGDTVTMPATITGTDSVSSIAWTPATGLSATNILHPVLTATTSGWYDITVQSLVPVCSVTDSIYVNVHTADTAFSHTDTTVCVLAFPLTLNAPAVYTSYIWNTGAATSSINVTGEGVFWVKNVSTCTLLTDTFHISITNPDTVKQVIDTSICSGGGSVALYAPSGFAAYLWNTGDITPSITVAATGTYWVEATIVGDCAMQIDTFHIAAALPVITSQAINTAFCPGTTIILDAGAGYSSYLWNTGAVSETINVNTAGIYFVTDINNANCTGLADTFTVRAITAPVVALGADTSICPGDSVILSSPLSVGAFYWSTGASTQTIMVTTGGTYALTVTDSGCSAADTIDVVQLHVPSAFDLGADTILCKGDILILSCGNTPAIWNTGVTATNITVTDSGTYWAAERNACGITTDTINVDIEPCDIYFPNAFSPNNDGLNDVAKAIGYLSMFRNYKLSIYNRWGQRIFYTEDIYAGWDGKFNGVDQNIGTYFYMITYTLEGKSGMLKGDLTLVK